MYVLEQVRLCCLYCTAFYHAKHIYQELNQARCSSGRQFIN